MAKDNEPADVPQFEPLLAELWARVVRRGRRELGRAAQQGRAQLERRQLHKDLDAFWVRLGKTAVELVEGGEVDHPSLRKAMARIAELEAQIAALGGESATDSAPDDRDR